MGVAEDHLAAEVEAEPPVAHPADEGVDRATAFEADHHALAEPRLDRAFDHRPAGGNVDHRDPIFRAAENQHPMLDDPLVAGNRALFDELFVQLQSQPASPPGSAEDWTVTAKAYSNA